MEDNSDKPKRTTLMNPGERRKALARTEDDECLVGLAGRLNARAEAAEASGDHELAIEMRAASASVDAIHFLNMALLAMEDADESWRRLRTQKR